MKFKNVSSKTFVDVSLILAGILPKGTILKPGDIIEVKDPEMIKRVEISSLYEKVEEKKAEKPKEKKAEKPKGGK